MESTAIKPMSNRTTKPDTNFADPKVFGGQRDVDLCAWINGARVHIVNTAPDAGPVTALWSVYIQPVRSLAQQRWTGADVARDLCASGYVRLLMGDQTFEAGTSAKDLPPRDELRRRNATYISASGKTLPNSADWLRSVTERRKRATQHQS